MAPDPEGTPAAAAPTPAECYRDQLALAAAAESSASWRDRYDRPEDWAPMVFLRQPVPEPAAPAGGDLAGEVRRLAATVEALARSSPPALVPVEEAARALGLSVSTVRRRVKDGAIPSRKLGRALRVDLAGLRPLSREEVVQEARKARAGGTSPVSLVSRRGT